MNNISKIHLPDPNAAIQGRSDCRIRKLDSGTVDSSLIRLNEGYQLVDHSFLRIIILWRKNFVSEQSCIALQSCSSDRQLSFVLGFFGDVLIQLCLKGS